MINKIESDQIQSSEQLIHLLIKELLDGDLILTSNINLEAVIH